MMVPTIVDTKKGELLTDPSNIENLGKTRPNSFIVEIMLMDTLWEPPS